MIVSSAVDVLKMTSVSDPACHTFYVRRRRVDNFECSRYWERIHLWVVDKVRVGQQGICTSIPPNTCLVSLEIDILNETSWCSCLGCSAGCAHHLPLDQAGQAGSALWNVNIKVNTAGNAVSCPCGRSLTQAARDLLGAVPCLLLFFGCSSAFGICINFLGMLHVYIVPKV